MQKLVATFVSLLAMLAGASPRQGLGPIAYDASGELLSVSPEGERIRCAQTLLGEIRSPAWSPSGRFLLVEMGRHDGPHRLAILDSWCRLQRYAKESSAFIRPHWAPDGKSFFALNYSLPHALGRWSQDGKTFSIFPVTGLNSGSGRLQGFSFSPSGTQAAVLEDFKTYQFGDVAADGIHLNPGALEGFSYVSGGVFLSEHEFVFIGQKDTQLQQLWSFDVRSGTTRNLGIEGFALRDFVAVSPDGAFLVVCAARTGTPATAWSLWRFSVAAREMFQLTRGTEDVSPTWR